MGNATKKIVSRFWPLLTIFALVAALAFPYLAQGRVPLPTDFLVDAFPPWQYYFGHPVKNAAMPDVVTQIYPWKKLVVGLWQQSQVPLWNPYNFAGNPLMANYQSAVFQPFNWLFLVLPQLDAWTILIFLQPLLAGVFTYLFGRQLKLSQAAALLTSVSFMFCGFITCWLAYGTLAFALLWLPLILYSLEKKFYPLTSLALAASFFSGHFQISLYVLLAAGGWLVFRWLTTRQTKDFFWRLIFLLLGIGLAAPQLLPTVELYRQTPRSEFYQIGEKIPFAHLVTLLAPDFYGNPVTRNDRGHYAEWAGFTGVIPLILALYALRLGGRSKQSSFFVFLGLGTLLLTLPTPLLDLVESLKIPVLSTSAAARIIGLFSFSVAILAGFGFDRLRQDLKQKKLRPILSVAGLVALICLVIWGVLLFIKPFPSADLAVSKHNFILPTGLVATLFGLIVFFWLANNFFKKNKFFIHNSSFIILSALLVLTVFDLCRFTQKWQPFDKRENVYPSLPILEYLPRQASYDRVFGNLGMALQNYSQIQGLEGYDPMYLNRYGEFLVYANQGQLGKPPMRGINLAKGGLYTRQVLNLLGVKYLLHAVPDGRNVWAFPFWEYPEEFKKIYEDGTYEVYENLQVYPRAFMVYDYQVAGKPSEILGSMFADDLDLHQTVILEESSGQSFTAPVEPTKVKINSYLPNKIDLTVQTATAGLLFLSDNFYPGWQAEINGQPTKIYRADYTFRAVFVPAGLSEVSFVYQPGSFKWGLVVSVVSLAAVLAGFFAILRPWR